MFPYPAHKRQERPPQCLARALRRRRRRPRGAPLPCGAWLSLGRAEVLSLGLPREATLLPVGVFPLGQGGVLSLRVRPRGEVELRVMWPCGGECMVCFLCMVPVLRRSACVCARPVSGLWGVWEQKGDEWNFFYSCTLLLSLCIMNYFLNWFHVIKLLDSALCFSCLNGASCCCLKPLLCYSNEVDEILKFCI